MTVPERSAYIDYLHRHIPNLEVVQDTTRSGRDTWRKMIAHVGEDAAVCLEDDILLTKNFLAKITAEIDKRPDELIQFHSRYKADVEEGSRYRAGATFLNNQCVYYPPGMASKLEKWQWGWTGWEKDPNGFDLVVALYMQAHGHRYWQHCPSLVDHATVTSAVDSRRSRFRKSKSFVDPEYVGYPGPEGI